MINKNKILSLSCLFLTPSLLHLLHQLVDVKRHDGNAKQLRAVRHTQEGNLERQVLIREWVVVVQDDPVVFDGETNRRRARREGPCLSSMSTEREMRKV